MLRDVGPEFVRNKWKLSKHIWALLGPFIWALLGPFIWALGPSPFGPILGDSFGPCWAHSFGPGPGPIWAHSFGPGPIGPIWTHHHITTALPNILILWSDNKIRGNKNAQGTMTPAPKSLARGGLFCCSTLFLETIFGFSCPDVFFQDRFSDMWVFHDCFEFILFC